MEVSDYTNEMIWKICDNFSADYVAAFKKSEHRKFLEKIGSNIEAQFRDYEMRSRFSKKYFIDWLNCEIMLFNISGTGISAFSKMITLFPTFSTEASEETHSCEYVYGLVKFLILTKIQDLTNNVRI